MADKLSNCASPFRAGDLLEPIVAAAAAEGIAICAKTGIRWCVHGRRGRRLPSIRAGGRRLTTRTALREWLLATEHPPGRPPDIESPVDSESILAAHGLARHQQEGGDA